MFNSNLVIYRLVWGFSFSKFEVSTAKLYYRSWILLGVTFLLIKIAQIWWPLGIFKSSYSTGFDFFLEIYIIQIECNWACQWALSKSLHSIFVDLRWQQRVFKFSSGSLFWWTVHYHHLLVINVSQKIFQLLFKESSIMFVNIKCMSGFW